MVLALACALLGCDGVAARADGGRPTAVDSASIVETGIFAERVRPVLEARCATGGCHGGSAPMLGLRLGGVGVSSADVVAGLVNVPSRESALDLVEPGDPDASWLVRKAEGVFDGVSCPTTCGNRMPPAGETMRIDEIATLREWIEAGAISP